MLSAMRNQGCDHSGRPCHRGEIITYQRLNQKEGQRTYGCPKSIDHNEAHVTDGTIYHGFLKLMRERSFSGTHSGGWWTMDNAEVGWTDGLFLEN